MFSFESEALDTLATNEEERIALRKLAAAMHAFVAAGSVDANKAAATYGQGPGASAVAWTSLPDGDLKNRILPLVGCGLILISKLTSAVKAISSNNPFSVMMNGPKGDQ